MRSLLVVALLIGCGGGKTKQEPLTGNTKDKVADVKPAAKPAASFVVEMTAGGRTTIDIVVRERNPSEPLSGVTITVTGPALQGAQTAITDETGRAVIASLPPGEYELTAYYLDLTAATKVTVAADKVAKVKLDWDTKAQAGEVVQIQVEEPKFATAMEALKNGALGQAVNLGQAELKKKPSAQLHGAMAIARYGFALEVFRLDAFGGSRDKTSKDFVNAVSSYLGEMDKIQGHLAEAAKDGKFALELCVACMAAENSFFMLGGPGALDIERDKQGNELPEGDKRRRPTYRFDHGDLAWGRAFVHFNQALANIVLAYDWSWFDKVTEAEKSDDPDKAKEMMKVTIKLADASRITKAKEHIIAGLAASDEARLAFLSETDDDREWVPSPKQKNYASPLAVDDKLYNTWKGVVEDVRILVDGKTGISLKAMWAAFGSRSDAPAGFIDIGAMLNKPTDIVFELGMIDRIEIEKNAGKRAKLTQQFLKGILGNGFSTKMKPSPLTDRLIQLRKDQANAEKDFEDKLKYFIWLN